MSGIKRYEWGPYYLKIDEVDGFVRYSDHEAEVARLRAELEWLRSWLPSMQVLVSAVEEEFCSQETEISEPDESKVSYPEEDCPITFGMIRAARRAVDAAIGEGK